MTVNVNSAFFILGIESFANAAQTIATINVASQTVNVGPFVSNNAQVIQNSASFTNTFNIANLNVSYSSNSSNNITVFTVNSVANIFSQFQIPIAFSYYTFINTFLPGSPQNLWVTNQGGPNTNVSSAYSYTWQNNPNTAAAYAYNYSGGGLSNFSSISWTAATQSVNPIASYNIYRNGVIYDNITSPISFQGYIANTILVVTSAPTGGTSANNITNGKLMPGLQLFSNASGFVQNTVLNAFVATSGGGSTGNYNINFAQTVGSSGSPATFFGWGYNDTQATNVIAPQYNFPAVVYTYTVTAVDNQNNESPQAAANAMIYAGMTYNQQAQFNYGGATSNFFDTAGASVNGPYDVSITWPNSGGFLPVGGATIGCAARFETGAFKYLVVDVKVTDNQWQTVPLNLIPVIRAYGINGNGDTNHWCQVNLWNYGTPVVGQWKTFKVPLANLTYGFVNFNGRFIASGNLANVQVVGTSGQLTCDNVAGHIFTSTHVKVSGTNTGTGTFANGLYVITATNGNNTLTLGTTLSDGSTWQAISGTANGTTTGLTFQQLNTAALFVDSITSHTCAGIDGSAYIVGVNGTVLPNNSYITQYPAAGGLLTGPSAIYGVTGPNIIGNENVNVSSPMQSQGTAMYKFGFQWGGAVTNPTTYYINNLGFETDVALPSPPPQLQVINFGGPNNGTYTGSYTFNTHSFEKADAANDNYQGLSWTPSRQGTNPIDHYKIYRNNVAYDTVNTAINITGYIDQPTLTNVAITGTSGQFSCDATTLYYGELVTITGSINAGAGTMPGYTTGNVCVIVNTNGSTTFSLRKLGYPATYPGNSAPTFPTTTGSGNTGLTMQVTRLHVTAVSGGLSANGISDGKILSGLQLNCNASGFVPGSVIRTYLNAPHGGGGTGTYAVNYPQVCGSSGSPVTFTGWSYNDTASNGCISIEYTSPGNTYVYTVSAVDTLGNEGLQSSANAYIFRGTSFVMGSNFDYGVVLTNSTDTTGGSLVGPYSMLVSWASDSGGFQPVYSPGSVAGSNPMSICSLENFNCSGFKYIVMDMKVTDNNYATHPLQSSPIARGYGTTTGAVDVFLNGDTDLNPFSYATTPITIGQWFTVKIPLANTSYGTTVVQGYFVGSAAFTGNLTVTSVVSKTAAIIGGNAYVSGNGMPATSYVTGGTAGGVGTYAITGPNIVGNELIGSAGSPVTFTLVRNISYKIGTQWGGANIPNPTAIYVDNYGFSAT